LQGEGAEGQQLTSSLRPVVAARPAAEVAAHILAEAGAACLVGEAEAVPFPLGLPEGGAACLLQRGEGMRKS